MLLLLAVHALAAMCAPILIHWWGRRAFLAVALAPAAAAAWLISIGDQVLAGHPPITRQPWLSPLGLDLDFRIDVLAWLMGLVVSVIGALVLVYCSRYFSADASALGRFAGVFVAFAGAMLGLVTTDNVLALYMFWELTTVFSFLLIGHSHTRQASRRAALQAITVTTMGGLAMLAGLLMLALSPGGSFSLAELIATASAGGLGVGGGYLTTAAVLILTGALTKAAQVPFHFWLPAAMAAPTPVSAYLHAAAMVKAGVYLVARFAPGLSDLAAWRWLVLVVGISTMLIGGYRALRQHDLKLVLAFGTVSQLGFLIALVGHGNRAVALAGLTMLVGHAIFKAALFLIVGAVDHATGTRDLRDLSGLVGSMPVLAVSGALAVASMAGLPLTIGFLGKEAALAALHESPALADQFMLAGVVIGSVLTLAYGLRWWWGAFATKPDVPLCRVRPAPVLIIAPPALLSVLGVVGGLMPHQLESALSGYAELYRGEAGHLTLWAGWGLPVALTGLIIVTGVAFFVWRAPIERAQAAVQVVPGADAAYRTTIRALNRLAADVTAAVQAGSLPVYLSVILITTVTGSWLAVIGGGAHWPTRLRWFDSPTQAGVVAVVCVAALLAARSRRRMKAVLLVGFVGYGVAVIFALQGAPDLALTQAVVETVTLVVFVLVLRRLPPYFSNRPLALRWQRVLIGLAVGVTVALLGVLATGARIHPPVTVDYPNEVYEFGYGRNIVNVTLVDTRAWDTFGEISVLLAAATGVASLIFLRRALPVGDRQEWLAAARRTRSVWGGLPDRAAALRRPDADINSGLRAPSRGREWLPASATLAPMRRSVILEIGARMVFHTLLIFSLFLLFSGHNAPGGGFAGGMVAGIALIVRYLAGGRYELAEAAPVTAGALLGSGMFLAALAGLVPVTLGGTILQTTVFDIQLPLFGAVHLATALFFDMGVYLIVLGLVLDILRSLGSQIDRQGEAALLQAPEVPFDDPGPDVSGDPAGVDRRAPQPPAGVDR